MTNCKLTLLNDLKTFSLGLGTTQRWFLPLRQVSSVLDITARATRQEKKKKGKASTRKKKKFPSYSQVILYTENFKQQNPLRTDK